MTICWIQCEDSPIEIGDLHLVQAFTYLKSLLILCYPIDSAVNSWNQGSCLGIKKNKTYPLEFWNLYALALLFTGVIG